ncbi:TetR family transcriptional regulator [Rossellomorea aquimaris]|uniref:TetR/AcrR family transcriptional regulator n=1 Tax=Rossellomorea aquimaris TaxID=189382 RepID=UPI001CD32153|nr:TetR/AcrR family transcriptional regulator [Rossellomorea aquimaris]MCA1053773.1 TetR family transcriptional regulator [Rossellomorea aquimaris]
MPKSTFYNLKNEKKQVLIEAAKKEFSRVSLYEASISNILKSAGIPRGSFYQYFEDKEDAFFYLLNEHANERHEQFLSNLRKLNGDVFEAVTAIFIHTLERSHTEGQNNFIKNVLMNMNYKIETAFTKFLSREELDKRYEEVNALVDFNSLNISGHQQLYHLLQILSAVTFHNLVHSVSNELSIEEAVSKYRFEVSMLKAGLSKSSL